MMVFRAPLTFASPEFAPKNAFPVPVVFSVPEETPKKELESAFELKPALFPKNELLFPTKPWLPDPWP
jgi:hypothetical protein